MSTEKWKQVEDLFHAALELDPPLRAQFVIDQCADPIVQKEVLSLLAADPAARSLIQTPVPVTLEGNFEEVDLLGVGETIGAYKILNEVGRGGMGAVYAAVRADHAYEKQVAVKLLKRGMDTVEILRHFRTERQILADFDHPNIARLLDGGTAPSGLPYFVMEFVEGEPIDAYCDHHRLTITQRLELFRQVCAAVSYAHRHLVIHRDLKPSNILVTPEGIPKLLDFGIAKILSSQEKGASTATGIRLMTPEYASPEQAMGLPVTTVSDVYSLGVLLYELLSGRSPYRLQSHSPLEIARVIQDTEPLLPSARLDETDQRSEMVSHSRNTSADQLKRRLRGDLDRIIWMALRKEPQRRYQSVEQFSEDIRRHLVGLPVVARKDTIVYRMTKFARRNKAVVAAVTFVLLTLLAGVITTTWQARKAKAEQLRSDYAREFGDNLRYLESLLLSTYTAPLHDTREGIQRARKQLEQMEIRTAQGGEWAYGSGNNALGNGYLILKDYEKAKLHLENAWNSGYQNPSTAYALGKVLGILYLQTVTNADQLSSREIKQQMIRDADVKYAQQAIRFLSHARNFAESPAYVEGLIALYQKRYQEALAKTAQAMNSSSRPYEVMKLEGDIYFAIGREAAMKGDISKTLNSFSLAGKAYERATERARSDPDSYLANARRLVRTISIENSEVKEEIQEALKLCDNAILINPDHDEPYLAKSEVYFQQGIQQMYHTGDDARPAFHKAIEAAQYAIIRKPSAAAYERSSAGYLRIGEYESAINGDPREVLNQSISRSEKALKIEPHYTEAYLDLASAHFYIGEYQLAHGEDPTVSYGKVIQTYEKDLKAAPKDTFSLNLLALANLGFAEFKLKKGLDPRPELANAIDNYNQGLHMNPNSLNIYLGMALTFVDLAKYEMDHGISPEKSFQDAILNYNKSLEPAPDAYGTFNRGVAYLTYAEHKLRIHEDPRPELKLAMADFQKTIREFHLAPAVLQTASVHLLQARYQFLNGNNPALELNRAKQIASDYLKENPTFSEAFLTLGKINSLLARWAIKNHEDPTPLFHEGFKNLEKCLEVNQNDINAYLELSAMYLWQSEWMNQTNQPNGKSIDLGLQKTLQAEKIYPQQPEILAIRGKLLRLKNRASHDPALEKQAADLFERAFQMNPFLKSDYAN